MSIQGYWHMLGRYYDCHGQGSWEMYEKARKKTKERVII